MNVKVVYHSKTGNTRKIAYTIAKALNIVHEDIGILSLITEEIDLLFIGDGVYFGKPNKSITNFLLTIDSKKVKNAVVFNIWWKI